MPTIIHRAGIWHGLVILAQQQYGSKQPNIADASESAYQRSVPLLLQI
jgi:hypothetical protein